MTHNQNNSPRVVSFFKSDLGTNWLGLCPEILDISFFNLNSAGGSKNKSKFLKLSKNQEHLREFYRQLISFVLKIIMTGF